MSSVGVVGGEIGFFCLDFGLVFVGEEGLLFRKFFMTFGTFGPVTFERGLPISLNLTLIGFILVFDFHVYRLY